MKNRKPFFLFLFLFLFFSFFSAFEVVAGVELKEIIRDSKIIRLTYDDLRSAPFNFLFYEVDFGEDCYAKIDWEVHLSALSNDQMRFYIDYPSNRDFYHEGTCVQSIQGASSGSYQTNSTGGKVFIEISAGRGSGMYEGITLTFTPIRKTDSGFEVWGPTFFKDNVGIGTLSAIEALEVNGTAQATKLKSKSSQGSMELSVPGSTYAQLFTDRPYFYFNKPIRAYQGQLGSMGTNNLQLQTNGTTRMTVLHSNGNVGIGTPHPSEALEVKGRIKLHTINPDESQNDFSLSVDNTSYAFFNTTSGCFLFNQPVLALHGEFGTYGNTNLSLQTCGDTKMTILDSNGNVGIGIPVPSSKLHVQGDILLSSRLGTFGSNNLQLHTNGTTQVTILNSNGNVGIGVPVPEYKLDVNGTIRADEILIKTDGADFVFQEGYSLRSLHEVEQHISEKKHLPEIPSAVEMQEKGVGMAELQIKLLQKIEELTLYVIRQEKEIEELKAQVKNLNRR